MADNITTDNLINLDQLDPRNYPLDNSKLLTRTSGRDEHVLYRDFYDRTIEIAKTGIDKNNEPYNTGWNATFIDTVSVTSEGYANKHVLYYDDQEGSFYPKRLVPNDIDWSEFDENDFVKVNANGELYPSDISVTDLVPTDPSNANKFLQVSPDGLQVIESDFDFDSLLHYPDVPESNANRIDSGIYVAGYSTANRPATGDQGYIISSRLRTNPSVQNPKAAQIFISTDTDDIKFRKNDGTLAIDDFDAWNTIYHTANHPIRDDITSNSSINIASSNAVRLVNDKVDTVAASINSNNILSLILPVDGSGSNLDADRLDGYHFSDLEARYVNVTGDTLTGNLTFLSGRKVRLEKGTSFFDVRSDDSRAVLDTNNPVAILNGSTAQRLYTGGILVSNNYSEASLIPTNGVYSKGKVKTGSGYDVGGTEVIDGSGRMSWSNLKNVPSNVENLGTASQRDVGIAPDQVPTNSLISSQLLPPGAVLPFAGETPPTGWLVCDGSAVSRSTYAELYAYIGTLYGAGNGSTTFNLPDLRNQFVRGSSSTRPVGNTESDQLGSHSHTGSTNTTGNHTHSGSTDTTGEHTHKYGGSGAMAAGKINNWLPPSNSGGQSTTEAGAHSHSINLDNAGNHSHTLIINSTGGSETRPMNIALLYCIKY